VPYRVHFPIVGMNGGSHKFSGIGARPLQFHLRNGNRAALPQGQLIASHCVTYGGCRSSRGSEPDLHTPVNANVPDVDGISRECNGSVSIGLRECKTVPLGVRRNQTDFIKSHSGLPSLTDPPTRLSRVPSPCLPWPLTPNLLPNWRNRLSSSSPRQIARTPKHQTMFRVFATTLLEANHSSSRSRSLSHVFYVFFSQVDPEKDPTEHFQHSSLNVYQTFPRRDSH